jgi:RNA polymerase sigma-70 factor, ECF subfamily
MKAAASAGHGPLASTETAEPAEAVRTGAAQLYRAHAGFVAGFLTRMGARGVDVEDLTQEVFLVAHRRGGYVEGPARPTTWLAEIALRVLSTHRRTKRRKPERPGTDELEALHADHSPADEQVASRRALARVQCCLEGMDEEHRAVFVLYELEGEACGAIAAALALPVGTVYSRLHHARKKFMQAWSPEGGTP